MWGRTVNFSADFDPLADMGLVHLRSELRRSFPWSLELIAPQKCRFVEFAVIGQTGSRRPSPSTESDACVDSFMPAGSSRCGFGGCEGPKSRSSRKSRNVCAFPDRPRQMLRQSRSPVPFTHHRDPGAPRLPPRSGLIAVCSGFWGLRRRQQHRANQTFRLRARSHSESET